MLMSMQLQHQRQGRAASTAPPQQPQLKSLHTVLQSDKQAGCLTDALPAVAVDDAAALTITLAVVWEYTAR